jgi:pimeloyl-ACP methyl ester carboxylesterase
MFRALTFRRWAIRLLLLLPLGVAGCAFMARETTVPLDTIYDIQVNSKKEILIVFLPGRGDTASHYIDNGFPAAVREKNLPVDMVSVDAHIGYYMKEILVERLAADIIQPAIVQGYKNIWLVGISMGGIGALLYAQQHPDHITGIVAIAPYLGDNKILDEVAAAGGLSDWPARPVKGMDYQRKLWIWLKGYVIDPGSRPSLHLLYGKQDHLVKGHRLLLDVLPAERVIAIDGDHKWISWKILWAELLQESPF